MPELLLVGIVLCVCVGMTLFASALFAIADFGFTPALVFQAVGSAVSVGLFFWSASQTFT